MIQRLLEMKEFEDFLPVNLGKEKCSNSHQFGPAIREYYLIHYVSEGKGVFENPKNRYEVKAGSAFLIRPGEICTYKADSFAPWTYTWLGFSGKLAKKFDLVDDCFEMDKSIFYELEHAFDLENGVEEYLAGTLFKLYCTLQSANEKKDYVGKTISFIDYNYMRKISISEIAESLHINRKYLARIFKSSVGVTMQQYLINKRMDEAKRLLERGYNVNEVSEMMSYGDSFTFSKIFKKTIGKPPANYKKLETNLVE